MRGYRLLGRVVVNKRPRNSHRPFFLDGPAARAPAAIFNWPKVGCIHLPLHVEHAMLGDGVAEPRSPCWPDTVEHIGPQRHTHDQVLWVPNTHHIPRL